MTTSKGPPPRRGDELETEVSRGEPALATSFRLVVVEGPDRGRSFLIDPAGAPRVLVGQSEVCEIRLTDREISRRHAAVEPQPAGLRVLDLGSRNGTFVERLRIADATLVGGERLRLGSTTLEVATERGRTAPLARAPSFGGVVGFSPAMRRLYPLFARLAQATVSVLIEGETGTGKEVLAEAIHDASPRAGGPFVVFDCTAVPPGLVESELFGHEKGSFTGAAAARKGVFEQAHGGTLLIDEVGDLDLHMQPKLLRAIERLEVRRVGGDKWIHLDVRVLSATRRDLDREVAAGRFRDDLFHRLAVARVELPPLRERRGDVEVLAHHFWSELGDDERELPPEVVERWSDDAWPGNIRELRNAVARYHALGDPQLSRGREQKSTIASSPSSPGDGFIERLLALDLPYTVARDRVVEEFERQFVERLLAVHGEVGKAADASGIGKRYFQKIRARTRRHD
jgi:two-component system, NtrC family, response regulator HydG